MSAAIIAELPAAQRLALSYAPKRARAAHMALLALDTRLAAILRKRREPMLVQVRLAWWRDMLRSPPRDWPWGDAVLDLLRHWRDPAALVPLIDGWEALLAEDLTPRAIADFIDGRALAYQALAEQLGVARPKDAREAARLWALADLAANLSQGEEKALVVDYGRSQVIAPILPASLRPLAVLAALGKRALDRGGDALLSGPGAMLLALRTGFTGR